MSGTRTTSMMQKILDRAKRAAPFASDARGLMPLARARRILAKHPIYEPSALKRLAATHATREEEIDRMLRAGLFVDLFQIVRRALRASVESYSIKQMEPFFGFEREMPLIDASSALATLQAGLELGDIEGRPEDIKAAVRAYNKDDCRSAVVLRDWLENLRTEVIEGGTDIPRPALGEDGARPGSKLGGQYGQEKLSATGRAGIAMRGHKAGNGISPDGNRRPDEQHCAAEGVQQRQ